MEKYKYRNTYTNSKIQGDIKLKKNKLMIRGIILQILPHLLMFACFIIAIFNWKYDKTKPEVATKTINTTRLKETKSILNTLSEPIKLSKVGYCITTTCVYDKPRFDSNLIDIYVLNEKINYHVLDEYWSMIEYNNRIAYILTDYISNERIEYIEYVIPENNGFKSYMSYTTITNKSSSQKELQSIAYTGNYGIRMVEDRYCIAIGTAFNSNIGDCVDLILKNGEVIKCVVADIKADEHTKEDNITTKSNGCVSEFIVDTNKLDESVKKIGDVSFCQEIWKSEVRNMRMYEQNLLN